MSTLALKAAASSTRMSIAPAPSGAPAGARQRASTRYTADHAYHNRVRWSHPMNAPRHVGRALPEMKYGTRTIADAAPAASALPVATVVGVASTASAESDTAAARRGRMASCGCSAPGHAAAGTRCAATWAASAKSKGTRIAARPSEVGDGEKLGEQPEVARSQTSRRESEQQQHRREYCLAREHGLLRGEARRRAPNL